MSSRHCPSRVWWNRCEMLRALTEGLSPGILTNLTTHSATPCLAPLPPNTPKHFPLHAAEPLSLSWSFSLTDSVPSSRSLQGRLPRPTHGACPTLWVSFLSPRVVALSSKIHSVPAPSFCLCSHVPTQHSVPCLAVLAQAWGQRKGARPIPTAWDRGWRLGGSAVK